MKILTKAAVNITTAGPLKNEPIVLNKPFTKIFPFSGSRALSKNVVTFVVIPTKPSSNGPKVILPILSAKLVKPTTKELI